MTLRGIEELARGQALSSWITNHHWTRMAPQIPPISAFDAGKNLATLARAHDVTLFEYFETDHQGHRPDMARAHATLSRLDDFLAGVTDSLDPQHDRLVVASDHGNFEAQDHTNHTTNPSLVTIWGRDHATIAASIQSIADITPTVLGQML